MKSIALLLLMLCLLVLSHAQSLNDYRTFADATDIWTTISIWERFDSNNWVSVSTYPNVTNANMITIRDGANLRVTQNLSVEQLVIEQEAEEHHKAVAIVERSLKLGFFSVFERVDLRRIDTIGSQ